MTSDTAARFRARARQGRSRRRRGGFVLVCLLGLLAAAIGLAWSPILDIEQVQVVGSRRLPTAQVLAAGAVEPGGPLAAVDLAAARRRVEALPYVKSAAVRRDWPDRVVIEIVERVPALAVPVDGGVALYDAEGVRLGGALTLPRGVPLLRVAGGRPDADLVKAVVVIVGSIPASIRAQVLGYSATSPEDVTFALTGDREVVWGSPDNAADKAAVLLALLRRPATRYDVRAPAAPAVR